MTITQQVEAWIDLLFGQMLMFSGIKSFVQRSRRMSLTGLIRLFLFFPILFQTTDHRPPPLAQRVNNELVSLLKTDY